MLSTSFHLVLLVLPSSNSFPHVVAVQLPDWQMSPSLASSPPIFSAGVQTGNEDFRPIHYTIQRPSPIPQMATIHSFPSEILRLTFQLGAQEILDDERTNLPYSEKMNVRNEFLLAASLVCRAWRVEAQAVLWEELYIRSETADRRVFYSPIRRRPQTRVLFLPESPPERRIRINAWGNIVTRSWVLENEIEAVTVSHILSSVVELRSLRICSFEERCGLELRVHCLRNLGGNALSLPFLQPVYN